VDEPRILLAHGNGGRRMRELIEEVFVRHLSCPALDASADAVALPWSSTDGELVFTTDGFTVQPLEFPGGDIGSLAVHGTTNDLAVAGAVPRYLSLNVFVEEGFEIERLSRIISSLARAARELDVQVAAGDTKVLRQGEGGGLYLATTGIGVRPVGLALGLGKIAPGDAVLVSGPIGAHGVAVLLAREEFGLRGDLISDAASVLPLTLALRDLSGLRFMRDPTRGGLATVMHEVARGTGLGVRLSEAAIPVQGPVRAVCEMLGYDPYYLACEGRVVAVLAPGQADEALSRWRALPGGAQAALIGHVVTATPARVSLATSVGGERYLEELEDDPLPRIC
jgi:hydrogenase expression/formation protein HypE